MDSLHDELVDGIVSRLNVRDLKHASAALKPLNRSVKITAHLAYAMVRLHRWKVALARCVQHGDPALVQWILQYMGKHDVRMDAQMLSRMVGLAASCRKPAVLQTLMAHGGGLDASISTRHGRAIYGHLAMSGFKAELQALVARAGAATAAPMPVALHNTLVCKAARGGQQDILQWVLTLRRPRTGDDDPMSPCSSSPDFKVPRLGYSVCCALADAVDNGHMACFRMLLPFHRAAAADMDDHPVNPEVNPDESDNIFATCSIEQVMCSASGAGNEAALRLLFELQHPPRADYDDGQALCLAAQHGHTGVMRVLFASRHPPRGDCQNGLALRRAVKKGCVEAVALLMGTTHAPHPPKQLWNCDRDPDDVFALYPDDRNALLRVAARHGHCEVATLLLASKHAPRALHRDALLDAVRNGHRDMVQLLMSQEHPPDSDALEYLAAAASTGDIQLVKMVRVSSCFDRGILLNAAMHGHLPLVRWAQQELEWIPHDVCCFNEALLWAVRRGHLEVAMALLQFRIPPTGNRDSYKIISEACGHGDIDLVRALLECLPQMRSGYSVGFAMINAAGSGNVELATLLLQRACEQPPLSLSYIELALVGAAESGCARMAEMLLGCEYLPRADCLNGDALVKAAASGDPEVVGVLLRSAHPPRGDCQDGEALVQAASNGHVEIVAALLASAHPPRVDAQRWKALCMAHWRDHIECVTLLLTHAEAVLRGMPLLDAAADARIEVFGNASRQHVQQRLAALRAKLNN
jgi:ankyrin repeat protein